MQGTEKDRKSGNMVKKCLIPGCNPNYRAIEQNYRRSTEQKTPAFRLPRDKSEYSRWMKAIKQTSQVDKIPQSHNIKYRERVCLPVKRIFAAVKLRPQTPPVLPKTKER